MQTSAEAGSLSASALSALADAPQRHDGGWFAFAGDKLHVVKNHQVAVMFAGKLLDEQSLRRQAAAELPPEAALEKVLAVIFARRGLAWLANLNGAFLLALADLAERKLWLVRDHHGQQSLFYGVDERGRLWFGESLPQVRQCLGRPVAINYQGLADYLGLGYIPAPKTIYANIKKLPAGWKLLAEIGKNIIVEQFWRPELAPKLEVTWEEAVAETRRLLAEAHQRCRQVAPTAGILLSGGVDSNLLLGLAAGQGAVPRTFTVGFSQPSFDERPLAALAARRAGAEHQELLVTPSDLELLPRLQQLSGEPFADASLLPTALGLRLASANCGSIFTGIGGDELFAGYRRYRYMVWRAAWESLPTRPGAWLAQKLQPLLPATAPPRSRTANLRRLLETLQRPVLSAYASFQEVFSPELLAEIAAFPVVEEDLYRKQWQTMTEKYDDLELVEQVNALDLMQYLPEDGCRKMTLAQKYAGIETLAPIMDLEVTKFALRLPRKFRVNARAGKRTLLAVGRELMPGEVRQAKKRGFGVPVASWLQQEVAPMMREMADDWQQWDQQGWIKPKTVQKLVAEHLGQKRDHGVKLWNLLCLKLWMEQL